MRADSGWRQRKPHNAATAARIAEYNSPYYKRQRAAAKRTVDAGQAHCWRCGRWLPPHQPFHLGHDDHDRRIIRGPECPPCNLKAAARKGNAISNARRRAVTRWVL